MTGTWCHWLEIRDDSLRQDLCHLAGRRLRRPQDALPRHRPQNLLQSVSVTRGRGSQWVAPSPALAEVRAACLPPLITQTTLPTSCRLHVVTCLPAAVAPKAWSTQPSCSVTPTLT